MSLRRRLGLLIVSLYPEAWRARYAEELGALLEDDPPSLRGLGSLLIGAADAHMRPQRCWSGSRPPAEAMRLSVGALFACWIVVSVAGSGFAKETEHYDRFEHMHPVLTGARDAVTIGALLGAAAIALGGLPLVWHALLTASRRRDRRLGLLLVSPGLAMAGFLVLGTGLVAIAPARGPQFPAPFVLGTLLPLTLLALGVALAAALAPKAVMRRARPPAKLLRLAAWSGQALTVAILLVTGGLLAYLPGMALTHGGVGLDPSGPFGASTRVTLLLALLGAVPACACALVASTRARRAALAR